MLKGFAFKMAYYSTQRISKFLTNNKKNKGYSFLLAHPVYYKCITKYLNFNLVQQSKRFSFNYESIRKLTAHFWKMPSVH